MIEQLTGVRELRLQHIDDRPDGWLTVADRSSIPFAIGRVYYITRLKHDALRGMHAHRTLEQAIFCINGAFDLDLDDGKHTTSIRLDRPDRGIFMGPGVWHEMRGFTADCVILVLASAPYEEADYLREYEQFKTFVAGRT